MLLFVKQSIIQSEGIVPKCQFFKIKWPCVLVRIDLCQDMLRIDSVKYSFVLAFCSVTAQTIDIEQNLNHTVKIGS